MPSTAQFRLSITQALADQLATSLAQLEPIDLSPMNTRTLESRGGVYQLYLNGLLVYIGKADSSIPHRLDQHRRKISGRLGIRLDDLSFTAIYVDEDLSAVAPETLLIKRHLSEGSIPWNRNGFGNKDPGGRRDDSAVGVKHFDSLYPADLAYPVTIPSQETYRADGVARKLKKDLPFVFRYKGSKASDPLSSDLRGATVSLQAGEQSADYVFESLAQALPGWQITALPGYVVMNREMQDYSFARKTYRA